MTVSDLDAAFTTAESNGFAVLDGLADEPAAFEQLVRSSGRDLVFTPGERPLPGTGFVFEVTNRGRTTPPVSVWHTDTSYVASPPAFTLLLAVDEPTSGGETLILDQRQAHRELDESLRRQLAEIELLHVASRVSDPDAVETEAWHPLVRRHLPSNDRALYLSAPERHPAWRRRRRSGRPASEPGGRELIEDVYRRCIGRPPHRHSWRRGQVLIIDNRITLHRADHSAVVGHRTLWRIMTAGEIPIPERDE